MIPVEQRQLVIAKDGEIVQRGDCLNCCLASLLELPYEEVPFFVEFDNWHGEMVRWLNDRGWGMSPVRCGPREEEDDPLRPSSWPSGGYWLATVKSPRFAYPDGEAGLHLVVMCEDEIAWDPHPLRAQGHLGFVDGFSLRALDPARFVLRAAA